MVTIWRCSKCGTVKGAANKPLNGNCPNGGNHNWEFYQSGSSHVWHCLKCDMTASGQKMPALHFCPKGGNHNWIQTG